MENAVTYDYKTIKVKREIETLVCDTYENLGWKLSNTSSVEGSIFYVNLSFKRDRKIAGKVELLKLQEKADAIISNIENLQSKRKNAGMCESLSVGVLGTFVFGGGMSMTMLLQGAGYMIGGIALGIVGAVVAGFAYPIFKRINKKKSVAIAPIIEGEYDKLADICEEAQKVQNLLKIEEKQ